MKPTVHGTAKSCSKGNLSSSHWIPTDGALDSLLARYGTQRTTQIIGPMTSTLIYRPVFRSKTTRIFVHGNLGWNRDSAERVNHLLWGVAAEAEVIKPLFLFAEVFGQERGHPFFHFGFWYWIVPERVQVNAAYGNRFGTPSSGYWFSVGLQPCLACRSCRRRNGAACGQNNGRPKS